MNIQYSSPLSIVASHFLIFSILIFTAINLSRFNTFEGINTFSMSQDMIDDMYEIKETDYTTKIPYGEYNYDA
jgi:hypothetical protein